ncbi:hypothetical protein GCM10010978_04310 [Compostibacillus humi]|uniref:FAS1-like dehydratase domain-containing protein n=1 Tax=Compostibacillus humi TaxID=1245525 RepID=A0A8J3EK30_9BACI|nr:MaoC family dehydratase N-terminal domain-containing protein [Compostibacillus humi]GGH69911.1 hypothetical protein GCM10010978_04310 [Compostibacillus humi]
MFESFIGKTSPKVKNVIERGSVKKFALAIGDPHPLYIDEEYGKKSRYGNNIAPPTFPRSLEYGEIEGMELPKKGLIHGEQTYHYTRPLLVGEEVYCYTKLHDYYEKEGRSGKMGFIVLDRCGDDRDGRQIFSSRAVLIITETVRKAMMA